MAQAQVTIGYWGIRGAGQALRNLATYLNISFEDKQYTDPNVWFGQDKATLKSDFPNLPYLIDGEKVVTESEAIGVYLAFKANKADLLGSTSDERLHLAQVRGVFGDVRKSFYELAFNKTVVDVTKEFNDKVVPKLSLLAKHLGKNEYLIGKLSVIDFFFSEFLAWVRIQDGDLLASFPNLKDYVDRVFALPGLKEYITSDRRPKVFMNPAYTNDKLKN